MIRCIELGAADLASTTASESAGLIARARSLGANALCTPVGTAPEDLIHAARSAGVAIITADGRAQGRPTTAVGPPPGRSTWPDLPPGAAAAQLSRRHRAWPNALSWVRSAGPDAHSASAVLAPVPVPSNVAAAVRRMAGRPGRGFSAPWPEHRLDPAWASVTVLPEPPPRTLRPGRGFASNLWPCADTAPGADHALITATVRWGDRCHSWRFAGAIDTPGVTTVATLPLVRPVGRPLSLELTLAIDAAESSEPPAAWHYLLADDAAGVAFWSLSIPDE